MNNDAPVAPAPFKKIASLLHASRAECLVQKRPRELLLSMQLQGASSVNPDVLQAKVRVRLSPLVSPAREDSPPGQPVLAALPPAPAAATAELASHPHDHTRPGETAAQPDLPEPGPGEAGRPSRHTASACTRALLSRAKCLVFWSTSHVESPGPARPAPVSPSCPPLLRTLDRLMREHSQRQTLLGTFLHFVHHNRLNKRSRSLPEP